MNTHQLYAFLRPAKMHSIALFERLAPIELDAEDDLKGRFYHELEQRLTEMTNATSTNNAIALGRAASSLQAVASLVGAVETLAISCNIEFDAIAGRLGDAERRLKQLHQLWEKPFRTSLCQG